MDHSKQGQGYRKREVDWVDHGGIILSLIPGFDHRDILWDKFQIDKRRFSSLLLCVPGTTCDTALEILKISSGDPEITKIVLEKIRFTEEEFEKILSLPLKTFLDYPTSYPLIKTLKWPIRLACSLNLVPEIFYEKYLGAQI